MLLNNEIRPASRNPYELVQLILDSCAAILDRLPTAESKGIENDKIALDAIQQIRGLQKTIVIAATQIDRNL